jgi:hypothetical protein
MMKKIIIFVTLLLCSLGVWAQQTTVKTNFTIQKANPTLYLNGTAAVLDFYNGDITFTQSSNLLTFAGGNLSLGGNSLLMTGSLGATGSRLLQGWMTNLEITNLPTINGGTLATALSLSSYLLKTDTAAMLTNYINKADTASMLTNYINKADTAAMLSNYQDASDVNATLASYLPIANGTATGTLTTAALNIGGRDLSIDSIVYIGTLQYALFDGADTLSPYVTTNNIVDLSDYAVMLADSVTLGSGHYVTPHQLTDSLAAFSGGLSAGDVATQINDTIVARLSAAVTGIRLVDSTGNAVGNYVTRKALVDSIAASAGGVAIGDVRDEIADSLNVLRPLVVMVADSTGGAAGNYMPRLQTSNLVNDTIEARIAAGTPGVALADSNIYVSGYATPTFVDSRLGSGSGLSAERLPFIIGHTTGAPTTAST